jgi:hypothetical protein
MTARLREHDVATVARSESGLAPSANATTTVDTYNEIIGRRDVAWLRRTRGVGCFQAWRLVE